MKTLHYDLSLLNKRAAILQKQMDEDADHVDMIALESLEELQTTLEELRVAQEELLLAYQEVETERLRYQDLFNCAPDAYIVTNEHGKIKEANRVAADLLQVSQPFLVGKPLILFVDQPEWKAFQAQVSSLQAEQDAARVQNWQIQMRRRGGAQFPAAINLVVIRSPQQKIVGLRWMLRDVSEHEQTGGAFSKLEGCSAEHPVPSEWSHRQFEQFAHVASFDLQGPVRDAALASKLLARLYQGKLGDDGDELIRRLVEDAQHMQQSIRGLLAYAQAGVREGDRTGVPCESVLEAVLADLRGTIEKTQATVTYDPLPTVDGDAVQLQHVFHHLLDNALKFRSAELPRIQVSVRQDKGQWVFSVRDNGIGIAPRYAERIFLIFERLHAQQKYPGSGIGLAICKKIIEEHGGRIWVESERGAGATFYFTLPGTGEN